MKRIAALAAATLLAPSAALAGNWNLDGVHSTAGFAVRHMMVSKAKGQFNKLSGKLVLDDKDVTKSSVEATIDVGSIDTNEPKRDGHLKSPEFFDVEKFPTMTFKSTKVEKKGKDGLKVTGDLTLHGVTKSVVLETTLSGPGTNPWGQVVRGVEAKTKINRKDFGLGWNKTLETGGVLVGEEVEITIDAEFNPEQAAAPEAKK
jgi:polyisoprenoid-binding protein YceI